MLIALPVLPLLASTIVSPGRSRPSASARSTMYRVIRALIDPDGLRYSSLAQTPSTRIRGVPPIPSRTLAATTRGTRGEAPAAVPALVGTCTTSTGGRITGEPIRTDLYEVT